MHDIVRVSNFLNKKKNCNFVESRQSIVDTPSESTGSLQ